MPNPTNGNLKYIITTTIAVVIAVGSALALVVEYESPVAKRVAIESVVKDKLQPLEKDIKYMREDISEIKALIKELPKK